MGEMNSAAMTEAIEAAYQRLPENERAQLDDLIKRLCDAAGIRNLGPAGMLELIGKLGIWMVKREKRPVR